MANQPTIVAASLDDSQMKQSIANLVASVKRATNTITKDFDSAVDHINAKLKELGNGKNVSAKGGVSANATKQSTQAVEENTNARKKNAQAVSVASDAVTKETQKLQALQQSLSEASNREQEFVNKKQQAATAIAQENELLSKQQSELSALKAQEQALSDAHAKDVQARQKQSDAIARQKAEVDRLTQSLESAKVASKNAFNNYMSARTPTRMSSYEQFFGAIPNQSSISKVIEDYGKVLDRMRDVKRMLTGDLGVASVYLKDIASGKNKDYDIPKDMAKNILDGTKVYMDACQKAYDTIQKGHYLPLLT